VEKGMLEDDEDEDFDEDYNNDYMTNAMAIENQKYAEVMEMKEIPQRTESDTEILQSLKRLLHIGISYTTLEKSKIGIAVNKLRKHKLSEVRNSAKNLIQEWKDLVDRWVEENESVGIKDISKETPDSIIDEEGVCCPAVDDGRVPMETQAASVKDSTMKSCDCLNDDQNAQDCDKKKQENRQTEILNKGSSSMRFRIPLQKYNLRRSEECNDSDNNTTVNMKPCVVLNDESKDVNDFGLISLNDKMVNREKQEMLQNDLFSSSQVGSYGAKITEIIQI